MQRHVADIVRPLGALEHLLWLLDQARPFHLAFTAEIEGTADPSQWRMALDRVQARHPLLSARVEGGAVPRFHAVAGKPIPLRVVDAEPDTAWQAEVHRDFSTPFDPYGAPLIRAVVVHGRQRTAFTLSAHHSIIDGMSLCFLIRDTLSALSGEDLRPLPPAPSMDTLLGLDEAPAEPATSTASPAASSGHRLPIWPEMRNLRIEPDLTARIKRRAKQEGTTVHAALLTSIAIAGRELSPQWQDKPVRILSPINNRKVLGIGEDCGDYATGATTTFPPDAAGAAGFWERARQASEGLAPFRAREGVAKAISSLRRFTTTNPDVPAALGFAANALAREAVLTNHGELPIGSRYGSLRLDCIWPAILAGFGGEEQIILAATMNGSLCLTQSAEAPLPGLLETMRGVLAANV